MYTANIFADGQKIGEVKNDESVILKLPENSNFLTVNSGPYKSNEFSLGNIPPGAIVDLSPTTPSGIGTFTMVGAGGVMLSKVITLQTALISLAVVLAVDLIFLRKKWKLDSSSLSSSLRP